MQLTIDKLKLFNDDLNIYNKNLFYNNKQKNISNNLPMETIHKKANAFESQSEDMNYFKNQQLANDKNTIMNNSNGHNNNNAEDEKQIFFHKENYYKNEIRLLNENIKKFKFDLKRELDEKIVILKEFENLRMSQIQLNDNYSNLKNDVESAQEEIEKLNNRISIISLEKDEYELKYNTTAVELEEIRNQYTELYDEYSKILMKFQELEENNLNKNFTDVELYKIVDKYEEETFNIKCENNQLKNLILEIINLQITSADYLKHTNLLEVDDNYLINSPEALKQKIEQIFTYFKNLLFKDTNNYNVKILVNSINHLKEKNTLMVKQLRNEISLRRKVQHNWLTLRSNFRVLCRIRPFLLENEVENINIQNAFYESLEIAKDHIILTDEKNPKKYKLDYVFDQNSSQKDIYDEVSLLLDSFINGKNACVFAYGQAFTGKTHTIHGKTNKNPGIVFRVIKGIFELLESNKIINQQTFDGNYVNNYNNSNNNDKQINYLSSDDLCDDSYEKYYNNHKEPLNKPKKLKHKSYKVSLSIIEIYNENIYNLLSEDNPVLKIYESSSSENLIIPELNPVIINSFSEAKKLFKLAKTFRKNNSNYSNNKASRSHLIYTFHIKINKADQIIRSKFNLVDLAPLERVSKAEDLKNENFKKESISINLSLNTLSNVLNAVAMKNNHIPYRDSKLTHYLKESLNEKSNIMLILHISPNINDLAENISTLEFGNRLLKMCKNK